MLKRYCEITSCNGIIDLYIARKNKYEFVFWIFVMSLMLGASAYFTYKNIVGYIMSPTVTTVTTERMKILDLPDVMICYKGGMNVSAMISANISKNLIKEFHRRVDYIMHDPNEAHEARREFETFLNETGMNQWQFIKSFSYSCEFLVIRYTCMKTAGWYNVCSEAKAVIRDNVLCYVFDDNLNQTWPGLDGGVFMELREPQDSFAQIYPEVSREILKNHEFSISLERVIGTHLTSRSYAFAPNCKVQINLNTKRYVRMGLAGSECERRNGYFSSNDCFEECWENAFVKSCNCTKGTYSNEGKQIPLCSPFQACRIPDNVEACIKTCLPLCDEWIFEITISQSTWTVGPNSSVVYVGYNTMQYTEIAEVDAFTIDVAIANVGGQSGLWLGVSMITIIQALYYFALSFCRKNAIEVESEVETIFDRVAQKKTQINRK